MIGLLSSWQHCILLSASVLATETRSVTQILKERQLPANFINFFQTESIVVNTLLIIVSYTLHPFTTHSVMGAHSLVFRLFANIFLSFIIGTTWAFIASYSLKRSYGKLQQESMDNFDMLMMLLSPILSFLMAETFGISGLLALMFCGFFQSLYASKNL